MYSSVSVRATVGGVCVCVSGEDSKEGEIFAVMWLRAWAKKRRVCSSPCSHRIYIRDIEMCVCVVGCFLNYCFRLECHFHLSCQALTKKWGTCPWRKFGPEMRGMERAEKAGMQCVVKWRGIPPLNIKKMLLSKKDKRVHIHTRSHTCTSTQRRGHTLAHIAERICAFTKWTHKCSLVGVFILSLPDSSAL